LAAYCLLVEENFGVRSPHGILQYRDRAFAIDYTDDLKPTCSICWPRCAPPTPQTTPTPTTTTPPLRRLWAAQCL
jgi:hypothetical protein